MTICKLKWIQYMQVNMSACFLVFDISSPLCTSAFKYGTMKYKYRYRCISIYICICICISYIYIGETYIYIGKTSWTILSNMSGPFVSRTFLEGWIWCGNMDTLISNIYHFINLPINYTLRLIYVQQCLPVFILYTYLWPASVFYAFYICISI